LDPVSETAQARAAPVGGSADPVVTQATDALKAGGEPVDTHDAEAVTAAHRELLTLHELVAHRIFQILVGAHRGRTYSV